MPAVVELVGLAVVVPAVAGHTGVGEAGRQEAGDSKKAKDDHKKRTRTEKRPLQ